MDLLNSGFKKAKTITKNHARTFYLASRFLPEDKRLAAYSVYAICRITDESVDNPANTGSLNKIKQEIDSAYSETKLDDDLLVAFRKTVDSYGIPKRYFDDLIDGMHLDLAKARYQNFKELKDYCYKVAGVVGLIMLKIFGYTDKRAETNAVELGTAMQLTNILRDIKEDLQKGRIYLPQDELKEFGVSESDISSSRLTENFKSFLKFQIDRARQFYAKAEPGIELINDRSCRRVTRIMKNLYSGILEEIENNNYDVFSQRAYVNNFKKLWRVLKILLGVKS